MARAGVKEMVVFAAVAVMCLGGKWAQAQVHHVVGGDRGWDPSSGVDSWSSGRVFRVGDRIWFTYSAAQGGVAEVRSREEYESCDVANPIKMYTDGLDSISLDNQGPRFFASSNPEHCKSGLKLNVEVLPQLFPGPGILQVTASEEHESIADLADGPTSPSGSGRVSASSALFAIALIGLSAVTTTRYICNFACV